MMYCIDMYMIEEFFYAACELAQFDWADYFLDVVRARFGSSVKVMRMLGVYHEAKGEPAKAQEIYLDMIDENPAD